MIIQHDLTDAVLAIAGQINATGGRLETRYSTPAWVAELTNGLTGEKQNATGPTASQAIEALGRKLRRGARP